MERGHDDELQFHVEMKTRENVAAGMPPKAAGAAALGAGRGRILALVIAHGLRLALAGLALGTLASLGLTRLLAGFLYGVSPADPLTFIVVGTLLACVALLASYLPARRAASVDPLGALRSE